MKELDERSGW